MTGSFDVAVMHDFFVDRLVHTKNLSGLLDQVKAKASSGGGGIHGIVQSEIRGGNAVNLAHALAMLGLKTLLLTHTDRVHRALLLEPFEGLDAEVRAKPKPPGLTVAFEERENVMLGHGGGAANFGPKLLGPEDWRSLKASRVVCSVNWAANKKGTQLLYALRKELGRDKPIFFDPADVRDRVEGFAELLKSIQENHLVDWMSLNEQEAATAADAIGVGGRSLEQVCLEIGKRLRVRLDIHTKDRAITWAGHGVIEARTGKVKRRRLTGAGDVWDAASICGRLKKMRDAERLKFANAAAGLYIEAIEPTPPTLEQVLSALG